ncbi:hypothetical protein LSH36_311g03081 [Paralvinella palmiformis]|uniref:Uncharacterized protein n=1 Tax=Paralvinella palmiformis TaxID=53620 RepID=A0AAD9JHD7_9ANNE|nr:hypothetical protein LSH36_311g03081 [Paralvinella palmiformis]
MINVSCMAYLPSQCHIVTMRRLWNIQDSVHTKSLRQGDMFTLQHRGKGIYLMSSYRRCSAPIGHKQTLKVTERSPNLCPLYQCVGCE